MQHETKLLAIASAVFALAVLGVGLFHDAGHSKDRTERPVSGWAIGIYTGASPFSLSSPAGVDNPILAAQDVRDISAEFVADPFMVRDDSAWYMFFEVMNTNSGHGDIAVATSRDASDWRYMQVVLDEPFHLSFPCVVESDGSFYMIPESWEAGSIRLYRATRFPVEWSFVKVLIRGPFVDSSVFRFEGRWWMFTTPRAQPRDGVLRLFSAESILGEWVEHPRSPVVANDRSMARPAGRVVMHGGRPFRLAQDDVPVYGKSVRAFEVTRLTATDYAEREVPESPVIGATGSGWNGLGMHHMDAREVLPGQWVACVDGTGTGTSARASRRLP